MRRLPSHLVPHHLVLSEVGEDGSERRYRRRVLHLPENVRHLKSKFVAVLRARGERRDTIEGDGEKERDKEGSR